MASRPVSWRFLLGHLSDPRRAIGRVAGVVKLRCGADKSAVGAINRPLHLSIRSLAYNFFIHPSFLPPLTFVLITAIIKQDKERLRAIRAIRRKKCKKRAHGVNCWAKLSATPRRD